MCSLYHKHEGSERIVFLACWFFTTWDIANVPFAPRQAKESKVMAEPCCLR